MTVSPEKKIGTFEAPQKSPYLGLPKNDRGLGAV